jgi:hypothetical protein
MSDNKIHQRLMIGLTQCLLAAIGTGLAVSLILALIIFLLNLKV